MPFFTLTLSKQLAQGVALSKHSASKKVKQVVSAIMRGLKLPERNMVHHEYILGYLG